LWRLSLRGNTESSERQKHRSKEQKETDKYAWIEEGGQELRSFFHELLRWTHQGNPDDSADAIGRVTGASLLIHAFLTSGDFAGCDFIFRS
jgi:hypothetical protein